MVSFKICNIYCRILETDPGNQLKGGLLQSINSGADQAFALEIMWLMVYFRFQVVAAESGHS